MSLSTDDMRKGDPRKPRELSGLVWGIFRALNFFFFFRSVTDSTVSLFYVIAL